MGIQLDWQVEAEQTQMSAQEDPERKKRRRRERRNILLASLVLALCICAAAAGIWWRWKTVEQRDKDDLRAAVEAEFAALRIGDPNAYMALQRSASDPWLEGQRSQFDEYQAFKQAGRISGSTKIVDIKIDKERGRVIVEEIIDGAPYHQVWFYWRYEPQDDNDTRSGWRHVPPDVTFWGEERTIDSEHVRVVYYELDERIASALAEKVETWWASGCVLLTCPTLPEKLELIIDPQAGVPRAWEPSEGWRLRVVSPHLNTRVPMNVVIPPVFEQEIATMLAQRLLTFTSSGVLQFPENESIAYDTTWLKYQLVDWLVARFLGQQSPFFDSITLVFGEAVPGNIARSISSTQQINQIAPALAAGNLREIDLTRLGLIQWQAFFEWRMQLEHERLLAGDMGNFYVLYEGAEANQTAIARASDATYRVNPVETVQSVAFSTRPDGTMAVVLSVVDAAGVPAQTQFMWNGDTFLRVN